MQRLHRCVVFVALMALAAACSAPPAPATLPAPTSAPARPETLHIEIPADPDLVDLPWLMAVESLREQGYQIETISFDGVELTVAAMEHGDLDFSSQANPASWAAIHQGAPMVTIVEKSANSFLVIASQKVQQCADLDDKAVASTSPEGVPATMLNVYIAANCPDAKPDLLEISGGSNRRAALLAGEVDAAILDVDDLINVQAEGRDDLHAWLVFAEEFPGLSTASYFARRGLTEEYPQTVVDALRALLLARRELQDVEVLTDASVSLLGLEPDEARQAAETYLAQEMWAVNGDFTLETVQAGLDFLATAGNLSADISAEEVANVDFLNVALNEIGRK